jgi:hypothetical protein
MGLLYRITTEEEFKKIGVVGDIHGKFDILNDIIRRHELDLVLCTGEFGYWPRYEKIAKADTIDTTNTTILFCDGNHEDHMALKDLTHNEVAPRVFYMPRGSTFTFKNGKTALFLGGANSIDAACRTYLVDYFPSQEILSASDFKNLPDYNTEITYVISHTCPTEMFDELNIRNTDERDPSRNFLTEVLNIYKPRYWFFGHFHMYATRKYNKTDTKWMCLNRIDESNHVALLPPLSQSK